MFFFSFFFSYKDFFEGATSGLGKSFATKNTLKRMKNIFYFTLKLFLFLRYWNIMQKNCSMKKLKLISKFMTSWIGKQIITTKTLPYISRSEDSQTMKFGELIEYNMRNIFFENTSWKCGQQTSSRFFFKNLIWPYLCINSLKLYTVCYYCMSKWLSADISQN